MSGTDHAKHTNSHGRQPAIILVAPQMGENIGAAARAMWNFGLHRLRLVNPRDGWPNSRAVAMASGAASVLDAVRVCADTNEALADLHHVYATTARIRDLTKAVVPPEAAMRDARARIRAGENVGFLFGPERAGLENADIVRAGTLVSVPVNPAFGSLNLAQCVLLLAYEWQQSRDAVDLRETPDKDRAANGAEVEKLYENLRDRLADAGFFWPADKADSMALNLRNLLSRLPLTGSDVRMLHGVVKALAKKS